jgi:hypothetical protein
LRSPEPWLSLCLVRPMRARTLTTAIFVCLLASTIADEEKPLERLHYALRHMDNPGDVIYQAQLDGLDYRAHLRRAIVKDRRSLAALFDYTENGQLMGVGAEEHCEVLYNLLQVWGTPPSPTSCKDATGGFGTASFRGSLPSFHIRDGVLTNFLRLTSSARMTDRRVEEHSL